MHEPRQPTNPTTHNQPAIELAKSSTDIFPLKFAYNLYGNCALFHFENKKMNHDTASKKWSLEMMKNVLYIFEKFSITHSFPSIQEEEAKGKHILSQRVVRVFSR